MLINWVAAVLVDLANTTLRQTRTRKRAKMTARTRLPLPNPLVKSVFRTARTVVNLSLTYLPIEIYASTSTMPKIKLIQIGLSKSYSEMHPYL